MKCPLLLPLILQLGGLPDGNEDECKREECAWFVKLELKCAVNLLGQAAHYQFEDRDRGS